PSKYLAWLKDNTGPRTEVTHTYYDVQDILRTNVLVQQELRSRPASITYTDTLTSDSLQYNFATHYSYEVLEKSTTAIQDNPSNGILSQRYKRIDYQFDLNSNNLNEIDYQSDSIDQYHQKYSYDADNRLTIVETSKDSIMWDCDARYFYYAHLPLARTELGDQQVQGLDFAYTLQGWAKGMNSDQLDRQHDMGHDGLQQSGNLNRFFARDAVGYTLKYFTGDYDPINKTYWNDINTRFEANPVHSDLMNTRHDLFNGSITAMVTAITQPQKYSQNNSSLQPNILPQGTSYNYDQLNRLTEMKAYQNLNSLTNTWETTGTYNGLYHNWFTYDANGNILTQKRADSVGEVFDSLTYQYNIQGGRTLQNRLYHMNDAVNIPGIHNDIKDEGPFNSNQSIINSKNNYRYDAIGELSKDSSGGIDTIVWTSFGTVWKIKKHNGDSIIFAYDPYHRYIMKEYKPLTGNITSTFYIRNTDGMVLSIYTKVFNIISKTLSYNLTERDIYGGKKIGIDNTPVEMVGVPPPSLIDTFCRYLGEKEYELLNKEENVLGTVSDRKIARPNSSMDSIGSYEADVLSATDYYPFGWYEPGRNYNSNSFRYAFNNKEKMDEVYGADNFYDFGARMYDPRLGRFMSQD
ncbi:MAG TPA: hypothetical protein VN922_11175, partial [Bacteroidia bacterium]|nr:hypothetical protein [Bacteroidia bacterium]